MVQMPAYFYHIVFDLNSPSALCSAGLSPTPPLDFFSPALFDKSTSAPAPRETTQNPGEPSFNINSDSPPALRQSSSLEATTSRPGIAARREPLADKTAQDQEDWRYDEITLEAVDMEPRRATQGSPSAGTAVPAELASQGLTLRGKFIPSSPKTADIGHGVVHLYRDMEPSDMLAAETWPKSGSSEDRADDSTTLCILAVPSYMTPSDLLGWVGEQTMEHVSHFRLIRTARSNKYMVLMKFHEAEQAKKWQRDWNGRLFSSMEVSIFTVEDIVPS